MSVWANGFCMPAGIDIKNPVALLYRNWVFYLNVFGLKLYFFVIGIKKLELSKIIIGVGFYFNGCFKLTLPCAPYVTKKALS